MTLGFSLERIDLTGAATREEAVKRVARRVAARDAEGDREGWIRGWGWDQNPWPEGGFPTRHDLDRVSGAHPVALTRVDGHALWVNTKALEAGGISASLPDPPGGRILRDEDGRPAGVLIDNAEDPVRDAMPRAGASAKRRAVEAAQEVLLKLGVTGVHDMGMTGDDVALYRELARDGRLKVRIYGAVLATDPGLEDLLRRGPDRDWEGGVFKLGMVKFYTDGALGSRGAAMLAPYDDDPGNRGLLLLEPDELRRGLERARKAGFQCAVHAIGDRANRMVLDVWEGLGETGEGPVPPLRLEHAQVLAPEDLPRVGCLGVLASMQPAHCTSDMPWAGERLGPDRMEGAYAWNTLRGHGATLAFGSDFPIEPPNPFFGFHAAVTRTRRGGSGVPPGSPGECVSREEALTAFTSAPAFASGDGEHLGRLVPGAQADLLVLDRDPLACEPDAIPGTRVLATVVGGRTLWADPEAFPLAAAGERP
jgi:predicted amidohydrolase YtcJ